MKSSDFSLMHFFLLSYKPFLDAYLEMRLVQKFTVIFKVYSVCSCTLLL